MNRLKTLLLFVIFAFSMLSCKDEHNDLKDGIYAELQTSKGDILLQLDYQKAPITVANFITLAEGTNPFVREELKGKPFYDGISFHRVIQKFMIQTGDPFGNGAGDAGYAFKDEITDLKHDKPGILSMANSGPNTNSSQFFITHVPTEWLDGKHTVFGHIVDPSNISVVNAIMQGDMLNKVTIIRKGEAAKKFNAVKIFGDYFKIETQNKAREKALEEANKKIYEEKFAAVIAQNLVYFNEVKETAPKSPTGVQCKIIYDAHGPKPKDGAEICMKYSGFLADGTLFDTSEEDVAKKFGKYDARKAHQIGYRPLPYTVGTSQMIPGFAEGIKKLNIGDKGIIFIPAKMAYGEQGAGNVIPPNADLIFVVQLIENCK
ncbi:peptidylprolyl isomerase [Flavobacterium capsici]|uniref:peptidylprolyl isomerase n=1 Tax=Flavobacterium capsici TaxID=3075618 RepID=A0AA96F6I8_9FLAO|nr:MULTISPECIES: peptidylprolyl isomerase [unclassified Flavobacterium]WNM18685.1 peptidylprolyl isomerase [Flavobacterium sp. PMR2A8]WNM22736.1 peptidylprolyl isomerase [Flavobacterium sp. PMTSA4]